MVFSSIMKKAIICGTILALLLFSTLAAAVRISGMGNYMPAFSKNMLKNAPYADRIRSGERIPPQLKCVQEIMPDEFEARVYDNPRPVIVKLYSQRCLPCQMMAPYYEQVCFEYRDRADFVALDVFQDIDFYYSFGLSHVPALIFYSRGMEVERVENVMPELGFVRGEIRDFLERVLH